MKVRGLSYLVIEKIARDLDLVLSDAREEGRDIVFKLRPITSHTYYSRTSLRGRAGRWLCFHGWRDFIRVCFVNGATRIKTMQGNWKTVEEFDAALPRMERLNVGSELAPRTPLELCTHKGHMPLMLRRAVEAARRNTQTLSEGVGA